VQFVVQNDKWLKIIAHVNCNDWIQIVSFKTQVWSFRTEFNLVDAYVVTNPCSSKHSTNPTKRKNRGEMQSEWWINGRPYSQ